MLNTNSKETIDAKDSQSYINSNWKPPLYLFTTTQMICVKGDTNHNILYFQNYEDPNDKKLYKYTDQTLNLLYNVNQYISNVYNVAFKTNSTKILYLDKYNNCTVDLLKRSFFGYYSIYSYGVHNTSKSSMIKFNVLGYNFNYVYYDKDAFLNPQDDYDTLLNNYPKLKFIASNLVYKDNVNLNEVDESDYLNE